MKNNVNQISIDTVCATLSYALGVDAPMNATSKNTQLCEYIDRSLGGQKADRVFMYNPDAIAQWIYEKYNSKFESIRTDSVIEIPLCTVMPSVTPVCFGTMYTGAQPSVHGIQSYKKPVITIDTLFDALIRAGKKPAIVADKDSSMAHIYLERNMDYYFFDTVEEVNSKAQELIVSDKYDFIAVYNADYDAQMHRYSPEGKQALDALDANIKAFSTFCQMIEKHWKSHNTLVGFAMDHGCHEIDGKLGSHGLDMEEDLNIVHLYRAYSSI